MLLELPKPGGTCYRLTQHADRVTSARPPCPGELCSPPPLQSSGLAVRGTYCAWKSTTTGLGLFTTRSWKSPPSCTLNALPRMAEPPKVRLDKPCGANCLGPRGSGLRPRASSRRSASLWAICEENGGDVRITETLQNSEFLPPRRSPTACTANNPKPAPSRHGGDPCPTPLPSSGPAPQHADWPT